MTDDACSEEENPILHFAASASVPLVAHFDTTLKEQSVHTFDSTQEDADDNADTPLGMDVDDFLPDTVEGIEESVEPETFSKTLMVDGKEFLKSSVVASLSSNRSKKVTI